MSEVKMHEVKISDDACRSLRDHLNEWRDDLEQEVTELQGDGAYRPSSPDHSLWVMASTLVDSIEELRHAIVEQIGEHDVIEEPTPQGSVWIVATLNAYGKTTEIELFSQRPETPGIGGDWDNWPRWYTVSVGGIDGGDSLVHEISHPTEGQLVMVEGQRRAFPAPAVR